MAITSPYNFVPLNRYVYIPSWFDQVSQDIPFGDGEDGWIGVKWRNESPLFIRDASFSPNKEECVYSTHIKQTDGKRLYFIPGSSMKGMLRSILTILSYGKMVQYNNRFFGHREFNTRVSEGKEYQAAMQGAKVGWLEKQHGESGNEIYQLHPCTEQRKTIETQEVSMLCVGYDRGNTSWLRNKAIKERFGTFFPEIEPGYRLFCTGWIGNKRHEMLIPVETRTPIALDEKVARAFLSVYEPSPDRDKYLNLLENGEKIPVSYVKTDNGEIKAIGLGRMFRYPYKYDIQSLVENEQNPKQYTNRHDLAETIFGWAENKNSMKGRVQIGNAFATKAISDKELTKVSGVLGQPKASFYPLYIKQDTNKYKTYEDANAIAGRKLYRVHYSTKSLPQGNGNNNIGMTMRPVPAGQEFTMRINLHNMRPIEIGALLWAITFNYTQGVWHNIGQAKSFGYGKLACMGVDLKGLQKSEKEYLKDFEREMTLFAFIQKEEVPWCQASSNVALINILSEHTDDDVRMLEMERNESGRRVNEYEWYKKNTNFSTLVEGKKMLASTLSNDERNDILKEAQTEVRWLENIATELSFKARFASDYKEAEKLLKEENLEEAKSKYQNIVSNKLIYSLDHTEEDSIIAGIDAQIAHKKAEEEALKEAEERRKKEAKLKAGLDALLEEKLSTGEYKIKEWRVCKQKIDKWLRDKVASTLDQDERNALAATVKRIKDNPVKKEAKEWNNPESHLWSEIAQFLGEDEANKLKQ